MSRSALARRSILILFCGLAVILPSAASAATSKLTFKLPVARHATALTAGSDGSIWFRGLYGAKEGSYGTFIGRVSNDGVYSEIPLPEGHEVGAPVSTPEGDAWFPVSYRDEEEKSHAEVVRASPSGEVTSYPLGGQITSINAIAIQGGDLWFAGTTPIDGVVRGTVGRIAVSTDASVQQFPLAINCGSAAIAGAAAAVFFTESCLHDQPSGVVYESAAIGRIDPTGAIVRYPLPRVDIPASLAIGPDGTVWFGADRLNYHQQRIGRIAPGGTIAEYRAPDAGFSADIAVGRDGRLWFPSSFGGAEVRALASIGPKGRTSKPICVNAKCDLTPVGLTTALNGTILFGAQTVHPVGGGGFTNIAEDETISNQAGLIGRLTP